MEFTVQQIAQFVGGTIEGNPDAVVSTFAKIEEGQPGAISFLSNPKYTHFIYDTRSTAVLIDKTLELEHPVKTTLIRVSNAYECVARLLQMYEAAKPRKQGISPKADIAESATMGDNLYIGAFAVIGDGATIGNNVQIYPNAVIGDNAVVGDDTIIYPNVTIYHHCVVGKRVIIHAGAVIGADGFGFAPAENGYDKIPQIGNVVIEDDVEIGANTCIDRSTMGSTIIHKGVKLDNLVQIAHNVEVGENTVMAAQGGIAGSTKVGQWCMFGGQVGMAGHITIADKTHVGAQAGITNSIRKSGETIIGSPAWDAKGFMKSAALFRRLPDMYQQLNEIKKQLEQK